MRLLVVEDEHSLREDIARKLRLSGYEVDACADGEAALEALAAERYDLVLLDLNLPKVDGMQVLRSLRQHDLETCVLILSARSEIADKVEGLDAGANDYLSKPFHLAELEARVRSLTRRKFIQQDVCLCCGRLSFNTRSRVAAVDGQTLALTRKESGVLEYLLLHQGRPVSQEELIEHVWDGSVDSFSNSIRVHISALRKKLRAALGYDPIRNRIGEGYEIGGCLLYTSGGAGVGIRGAVVGLDAAELVVQRGPCVTAHHAVHGQAVFALEGPHRVGRSSAVNAVHC